jgi:hypothetical protein
VFTRTAPSFDPEWAALLIQPGRSSCIGGSPPPRKKGGRTGQSVGEDLVIARGGMALCPEAERRRREMQLLQRGVDQAGGGSTCQNLPNLVPIKRRAIRSVIESKPALASEPGNRLLCRFGYRPSHRLHVSIMAVACSQVLLHVALLLANLDTWYSPLSFSRHACHSEGQSPRRTSTA